MFSAVDWNAVLQRVTVQTLIFPITCAQFTYVCSDTFPRQNKVFCPHPWRCSYSVSAHEGWRIGCFVECGCVRNVDTPTALKQRKLTLSSSLSFPNVGLSWHSHVYGNSRGKFLLWCWTEARCYWWGLLSATPASLIRVWVSFIFLPRKSWESVSLFLASGSHQLLHSAVKSECRYHPELPNGVLFGITV